MDPISFFSLTGLKLFWKNKKSMMFAILIGILLVTGATYVGVLTWQNHHLGQQVVTKTVENHDQNASLRTYETKDKVGQASAAIDDKFEQRHQATQKEYIYVREAINSAPPASRDAQADRSTIDTLNHLERMPRGGDAAAH